MTTPSSRATSGGAPRYWGNVPQRIKNFTGRADILERLRQGSSSGGTAVTLLGTRQDSPPAADVPQDDPKPHALQGLGGVGKTAVAIEYAHRYRREYDLVWWVPSDQVNLIRPALAALAVKLGLEGASVAGIESAAALALDALRRGEPFSRWLLIFDNADQPEDVKEFIPEGPGHVIVTSRNHRWQSVIETVQVDVFDRTESAEFLAKRVPQALTASDADPLADKLGDLPLALEQAGALLAETGMPVSEYLSLLDKQVSLLLSEGKPPEYPLSMTAAWRLSVNELHRQLPAALELLRCCAFFSPDPIPRDVFRGRQAAQTTVSNLIAEPIRLAQAIGTLGRYALVKIDGRMISVHRLIQALLREELTVEQRDQYRHEVHQILAAGSPGNPNDSRHWPRYGELLPHVTAQATGLAGCPDEAVRGFALDVVRYLYLSGDLESCRALAERFIAQWSGDATSLDTPQILDAKRHRGNALRQLGRYSVAYEVIEPTLAAASSVLGEQNELTLALRNSFGADLRARGEFAAALRLDLETQRLHEEAFGKEVPQTWRVANNVASDYALNADYGKAKELHQEIYKRNRDAATGVSDAELLTSLNGLAWAVRLSGDFSMARDLGEEARDFGQERLGAEHYVTLRAANGLSIALRRIPSAHEEALAIAREVYELCMNLLGELNPDTMAAGISLANIQRTTGATQQALELARRLVETYPNVYGSDHPYNHGCTANLALLLRVNGKTADARHLNETALAALDGRLDRDHDYPLTVAVNLASDYAESGDVKAARALGEDSLSRLQRVMGKRHPLTLGCAANLVVDLRADGAGEAADRLLRETMDNYAATLGRDHPDAVNAASGKRLDFDFDPPPI